MDENNGTTTVPQGGVDGQATTILSPNRDVLAEILQDGTQRPPAQAKAIPKLQPPVRSPKLEAYLDAVGPRT